MLTLSCLVRGGSARVLIFQGFHLGAQVFPPWVGGDGGAYGI